MQKGPISFTIQHASPSGARVGLVTTPHGSFKTPAFVPVGTKATVKAVLPDDLIRLANVEVVLGNTYHLHLQPGDELIRDAGGLHRFMNWHGPLVTDSGGFQVFSLGAAFGKGITKFMGERDGRTTDLAVYDDDLASQHGKLATVDDEGVTFTS